VQFEGQTKTYYVGSKEL